MNGRVYDLLSALAERRVLGPLRERLLGGLSGEVVEIGAGTGASFRYYPAEARVRAIEPDPAMMAQARERAATAKATIALLQGDDTLLDGLEPASLDYVVATLMLCSVEAPSATLGRICRVLKPDGRLVTIEHVRSDGFIGMVQDAATPLWRRFTGNCHLNRSTEDAIRSAGFQTSGIRTRRLPFPLPVQRLIYGEALPQRAGEGEPVRSARA
ncbi:MAG: class I SAM-dependent methyltransferase [bacterium]|nr:class I SAM-dependent methyltransferase [bacterium]